MAAADVKIHFEVAGHETKFRVVKFGGMEGISQLFRYEIDVGCEKDDVTLEEIIGKPAVLWIGTGDDTRFVSGMVSRFWWIGESDPYTAYGIELVPVIWLLTQRHDCRIFQNLTVPAIIEEVFKDARIPADLYDLKPENLHGGQNAREYCVQYHESDFSFISRLMEEEGIYFFFEHRYESNSRQWKHIFRIGNHPSHHPAIGESEKGSVMFKKSSGLVPDEESVYAFHYGNQILPGAVTLRDFDYRRPGLELSGTATAQKSANLEYYYYPGGFDADPDADGRSKGEKLSKVRLEEMRSQYDLGSGRSNCCRFIPGFSFSLKDHPRKQYNKQYLLTSIIQAGQQREVKAEENLEGFDQLITQILSHAPLPSLGPLSPLQIYTNLKKAIDELFGKDETFAYSNQFTCTPLSTPFRPPRVTPKPVVHGPQTATVVTRDKEQKLSMDDLGRVRVKFHWDRETKEDIKRTCDIRVAYNYAGVDHGVQFPPLVDDEVVVSFLEGDPDKPLITGAVYNGDNRPPLKPEEGIENILLTPYQHRLLLSDKTASITLNTGGNQSITMSDGETQTPFVGNQIYVKTADGHQVRLCKGQDEFGPLSAIRVQTQLGHSLQMIDEHPPNQAQILLTDKTKNLQFWLNSGEQKILIQNKTGPQILIDCSSGKVTVKGGGVEVTGGQVTINGSAGVQIQSAGSIKLGAPDIQLEGATVGIKAAQIGLQAPMVQADGVLSAQLVQTQAVVSASYTPGAGNLV
jgi:Rhs element Vgr protein